MDYLSRGDAPFSDDLWQQIDSAVIAAAKDILVARRFVPLYGPLGPGASVAKIDAPGKEETMEDGFSVMNERTLAQIPQLYADFWIYWRDLAANEREGTPVDLGAAIAASQNLALKEDSMIFYGVESLGIKGLLTTEGVNKQKRSDWTKGEGSFTDIATAIATLISKGRIGRHTLVISQDLYVQLQRIQLGTGEMEIDRICRLLDGRIFTSPILKPETAMLVCAQPQYMDLAVGLDISTAYTEAVDLNHHLRVMETALPRIKAPDAIVLFG